MNVKERRNLYKYINGVLTTLRVMQNQAKPAEMLKLLSSNVSLHPKIETIFFFEDFILGALKEESPLIPLMIREIRNAYIWVVGVVVAELRALEAGPGIAANSIPGDLRRQLEEKIDLFWTHLVFRPFFSPEAGSGLLKRPLPAELTAWTPWVTTLLQNHFFESLQMREAEALEALERPALIHGDEFLVKNFEAVRSTTLAIAEFLRLTLFLSRAGPEFARLVSRESVFKTLAPRLLLWGCALAHKAEQPDIQNPELKALGQKSATSAAEFIDSFFSVLETLFPQKNKKSKLGAYYKEHLHFFYLGIIRWLKMNEYQKPIVFRALKTLLRRCPSFEAFSQRLAQETFAELNEFLGLYSVLAKFKAKNVKEVQQAKLAKEAIDLKDLDAKEIIEQKEHDRERDKDLVEQKVGKNFNLVMKILSKAAPKKEKFKIASRDLYEDEFDDTFEQSAPVPRKPKKLNPDSQTFVEEVDDSEESLREDASGSDEETLDVKRYQSSAFNRRIKFKGHELNQISSNLDKKKPPRRRN